MIIISKESDLLDFDIKDLVLSDTKTNIIRIFNELKIDVPKKASKEELAQRWESLVRDNLEILLSSLPLNELYSLFQLLFKQQNEFVPWIFGRGDRIGLEDMYLTVICEGKQFTKMYMTDSIRKSLMVAFKRLFGTKRRINDFSKIVNTIIEEEFIILSIFKDSLSLDIKDAKEVLKSAGTLLKQCKKLENYLNYIPDGVLCNLIRVYNHRAFENINLGLAIAEYQVAKNDPNGKFSYVCDKYDLMTYSMNKSVLELVNSFNLDPIDFSDAFTVRNDDIPVDQYNINYQIVRRDVLKVSVRLEEKVYMVHYVVNTDGHISLLSCWRDILDFVRNGLEDPQNNEATFEVKKHFRKKYPVISAYLSEYQNNGYVQYLAYKSICNQPEMWWLETDMDDADEKDFENWCLHGPRSDDRLLSGIIDMSFGNIYIFSEINRSDAKSPKERMHSYFGIKSKPHVTTIENLYTYLDENFEFEEDTDEQ